MKCKAVSPLEAKKLIDDGIKIVDVRTINEYRSGHIKQTIPIPLQELGAILRTVPDKDEKILVYCHSGMRSEEACKQLMAVGYKNIYNLKGGIVEWPYELE